MSRSIRCGACKYMRRRCSKDCILAPYFPSNDLQRFTCVHQIFGASKVANMLEQLPEEGREAAAESLVLEARSRIRDPVHGTVGILTQLREQVMEVEFELARTRGLIALCQAQYDHYLNKSTQDRFHITDETQIDDCFSNTQFS